MAEDGEPDVVTLQKVKIEPNNCFLEEALQLGMEFTCLKAIPNASWHIRFIADTAMSRKIVELGSTPEQDYAAGGASMHFAVDAVNVAHLKRHVLANVGLLQVNLFSCNEEILQISMVTQVMPDSNGKLIRSIYSPLE
mmetsp:Transcript_44835/g.74419  ORF Transcript_44835/g.74419 Transcript_44835/m.74419 type:complete len:138 (+) Transcript_44835:18-431(+)|eukprot:CAMPEP_0119311280 /NCGR_PEP_ID=MMETSP1333-20130426/22020_1 /TAXON_ID=418940 /ORGANISM="Scyphosphaera apsteinii, Strain RCC1455" /LENGTH=137 /DNA_ID=CAMNT_0007315625 /DNA_START=17 /DNA_END=430 /DNA_ORIENTATION=-